MILSILKDFHLVLLAGMLKILVILSIDYFPEPLHIVLSFFKWPMLIRLFEYECQIVARDPIQPCPFKHVCRPRFERCYCEDRHGCRSIPSQVVKNALNFIHFPLFCLILSTLRCLTCLPLE